MIAVSFPMKFVDHAHFFNGFIKLLTRISAISIQSLPFVLFTEQLLTGYRVMYAGRTDTIIHNELLIGISFYMVLITIEIFIVFPCPAGLYIFMASFLFTPLFGYFSFFYSFVLLKGVPLYRYFYNRGINDPSFVHYKISLP